MATRSERLLEQLENAKQKELQLKAKQLKLTNKLKSEERKERTRRLIQKGALSETYFFHSASPEDFEILLRALVQLPEVKEFLQKQLHTESAE